MLPPTSELLEASVPSLHCQDIGIFFAAVLVSSVTVEIAGGGVPSPAMAWIL